MKSFLRLAILFLFVAPLAYGQSSSGQEIKYVDLANFPRIGQAVDPSLLEGVYDRLPASLKDSVREELWNLGKNSAGIAIRFRTDSPNLKARWEVLNNFWMNHMTPTGIKGLDLYGLEDGTWYFMGSARPGNKKGVFESRIISNMDRTMREYMLFLPLYDGATKVEIGVDPGARVEMPASNYPSQEKPVVVYGTSVTQGGCATRPGMAYTSILMRDLNREFINLGFSGNGRLDPEVAEVMAATDAGLFILDNMANCTPELLDRLPRFVEILRQSHPDTPILLLTEQRHTYQHFDRKTQADMEAKDAKLRQLYKQLSANDSNIHLLPVNHFTGYDEEATVDGDHFTDLGFMRMAENLKPHIINLLYFKTL